MFNSLLSYLQDARAAAAVAGTMLFTWLANVWAWLGPNIGVLTGILGLVIGAVTLYVQCLTAKIKILELKKAKILNEEEEVEPE